jgi:hypothetical protein
MQDVATPPRNDRAVLGGNSNGAPEADPKELLEQRAREYVAGGSAWLNEIKAIETQEQADAAGAYLRQGSALVNDIEKVRKSITDPLVKRQKDIKADYDKLADPVSKTRLLVQPKLTAYLAELDRRQREAAAIAAAAAAKAKADAEVAAERAFDVYEKAEAGELQGTGVNTAAAINDAEVAKEAAERAEADADRLMGAKASAGGQYSVNGTRRSVSLKVREYLVLDLPPNALPMMTAIALAKVIKAIADQGSKEQLADVANEVGRIANQIFKKTGEALPSTRVEVDRKAV